MLKKRRKKNNNYTVLYLISVLLIFIILVLFYSGFFTNKIVDKLPVKISTNTGNNEENYYQNSIIHGEGKLNLIPYDIKVATKFKLDYNNKEFFAKSDKYILDNYIDNKVLFTGEIIGFSNDNTPVLNITDIDYILENTGTGEENLTGINNYEKNIVYYKQLELNLENTAYQARIENDSLIIYQTGDNLSGENILFQIDAYKCQKGSSLYDCEQFKKQANLFKFNKLISNNGLTFYKLDEVNQYVLIGNNYGYNIFPKNGNIYKLIDLISLNNNLKTENIKTTKIDLRKIALQTCKNDKIYLSEVSKIIKKQDNNYEIIGYDKYSNKLICKIKLSKTKPLVVSLEGLNFLTKNEKVGTGNIVLDENIDESKYLIYKSKGYGFTLYMPKAVKYKSILIKNNFGVSGMDCLQQVNIANWKNGDLKAPELKVIYCKTNLDKDTLNKLLEPVFNNFSIVKKNTKTFIILSNQTEAAKKILNNLIIK